MKNAFFAILLTLAVSSSTAQTAPSDVLAFLTPAEKKVLEQKQELSTVGSNVQELKYASLGPWTAALRSLWEKRTTSVAMEALYLFDVPATDERQRMLKVFNAINAVSQMEGLPYYSVSAGKMETLVVQSYRVESAEKQQRLPDPTFTEIPKTWRSVVFQKDNKLGDGLSELVFQRDTAAANSDAIVLTLKNLTGLNYGIFPLVDSGQFAMGFYLVPYRDKILLYATMGVKTASLFGLERSKDESFRNRMRALAGWLGTQIQKR